MTIHTASCKRWLQGAVQRVYGNAAAQSIDELESLRRKLTLLEARATDMLARHGLDDLAA